jgi:hypothetical protein
MSPKHFIAVAAVFFACGQDPQQELLGHWSSPLCEAYPDGKGGMNYLKRDFTLTEPNEWSLAVTIYGDAQCTMPFVQLDVGGTFKAGAASQAVSGATEVDYGFDHRKLKPLSDYAAMTMDQTGCGTSPWANGVEQDLTQAGCAPFGVDSLADCPTEHDLNRVEGSQLFYGDRSASLCTARPTKLGSYAVSKQ